MRYLLDTDVMSDARLRRSEPLADWLSVQEVGDLAVSVITILELERGIRRRERVDPVEARPLRLWLDEDVRPMFGDRVLAIDERIAVVAAGLHVPDPRPEMDALIAATALVHDLTLVTRNTRDFLTTGARLFDPWGN